MQRIFAGGDDFKILYAVVVLYPVFMIDLHTLCNWANEGRIDETVRSDISADFSIHEDEEFIPAAYAGSEDLSDVGSEGRLRASDST